MLGLRHVLAPRAVTPEHAALGGVALLALAATPPVLASLPEETTHLAESGAALPLAALVTAVISVLLTRRALRAESTLGARLWLLLGGAGAGIVNTAITYVMVRILVGHSHGSFGDVLFGSLCAGTFFGFLFGTGFAPVVVTAVRARLTPSHEALDRVLFAAGASLVLFAVVRHVMPARLAGAMLGRAAAVAGCACLLAALARIVSRARLLDRVREGVETGLHVVPASGHEDEVPLVPLLQAAEAPSGVLTATGASAPYRGARGVFKLALVPLASERFDRPIAGLFWWSMETLADTTLTLVLGAIGLAFAGVAFGVIAFAWSAATTGFGFG